MHNKKHKTQQVFRGWDYEEIIQWMEVDYHDTTYKVIKFRLKKFYFVMKSACKDLFLIVGWDDEEREILETKKALELLQDKLYSFNYSNVEQKYLDKVQGLRVYIKRLSETDHSYSTPLWIGLHDIKDDGEFIKYVILLFECLWD